MIHDIPLMRSLDPHHARLGYLGVCAASGSRALDTYEALAARMKDILFEKFYAEENQYNQAIEESEPALRAELRARSRRSEEDDPAAILAPLNTSTGWLTRSEAWLYDQKMPSHVGYLQEKHIGRAIDLARWTGVLLPTLDLSEEGMLLQLLVTGGAENSWTERNLLLVQTRPALVLIYLKLLLRAEILFPALLCELADREREARPFATRGPNGLLRHAVARLRASLGEPSDPADMLAFRELNDFEEAVLKTASTEENYLRPRLEMLVDLGLLLRPGGASGEKPGTFPWTISAIGREMARDWKELDKAPQKVDEFLETQFLATAALLTGRQLRAPIDDLESLLWFARAYRTVQREIGFTPGRTVAQLACLLAIESGVRIETAEMFRVVYDVPKGAYAPYFAFSGGSRFDAEFMIRVEPALLQVLERDVSTREH